MKIVNNLPIVIFVLVLCAMIIAALTNHSESTDEEQAPVAVQTRLKITEGSDWPMFRGEQRLLGRASGTLPDSLELVWKFRTDGSIKSSPVIVDDRVFVGSSDANVYSIDLETGHQIWSYKTDDAVEATPCVVNGAVFIGSLGNILYALDANIGTLKWKYQTEGKILGAANWTYAPDGSNVWILIGSYDNTLHCVDSKNGEAVWTYQTDNYINGSPAVDNNIAVFGGCDALIHAISLANGSKITEIDTGSFIAASPAFLNGQVYVGNYEDVFVKADIITNQIVWKYTDSNAPFFSSPAVGDNVVVIGGRDQYLHCIDRNIGIMLWKFQTLGEVDSSPVICGDKVIVGSEDGRIYMVRLLDGTKVWSYEIGQPVTSSPAVAKGAVVIGCDDGYVYAFGAR